MEAKPREIMVLSCILNELLQKIMRDELSEWRRLIVLLWAEKSGVSEIYLSLFCHLCNLYCSRVMNEVVNYTFARIFAV
jgi:hypothetical protein